MGNHLPTGWTATTLENVANWGSGGTPSRKNPNFFIGNIPWIKTGELVNKYVRDSDEKISDEAIKKSSAKVFPAGSVGIAMYGATIGKLSIFAVDASTNQACAVAVPLEELLSNEFLYYYLLSERRALIDSGKGGAQPNISQGLLKGWPILLPPLNEQKRIVAKIEELFSELDNGTAALKTAREQLKVYRQVVLKHAFEGKLTAKWREENADKLESPEQLLARIQQERETRYQQKLDAWNAAVKTWQVYGKDGKKPGKPNAPNQAEILSKSEVQELSEIPKSWAFLRLGDFIDNIDAGKSFKCDEREPSDNEIGVAKVSAVTWGEYDESESKTCLDPAKVNPLYYVQKGDFILSRANTIELVGACVIARDVTKKIMLSDKTLRIRFGGIDEQYVLQYLRSHHGRNEIMRRSTGNQDSMRNIGQDRIKSIVVPVCSDSEMSVIVREVYQKLDFTSRMFEEIEAQLLKSETLRQSILKKAFSGQLVPQDPSDEPASELLAKIHSEKAAAQGQAIQPTSKQGHIKASKETPK